MFNLKDINDETKINQLNKLIDHFFVTGIQKMVGIYNVSYFHDLLEELNVETKEQSKIKNFTFSKLILKKIMVRGICVVASYDCNKFRPLLKNETKLSAKKKTSKISYLIILKLKKYVVQKFLKILVYAN